MKRTIVLITFILIAFNYLSVNAQPQQLSAVSERLSQFSSIEDDSLLFDGEFGFKKIQTHSGDCPVKVKYAYGKNNGVKKVDKIVTDCSGKVIDTLYEKESGQLKKDDEIYLDEEVVTGDDGVVEIELWDGSVMRMAPNTAIKITSEFCDTRNVFQRMGNTWTKIKKIIGVGKFEVSTDMMVNGVRGTEFSVKIGDGYNVLKVYEGTVETKLVGTANVNSMDEIAKQTDKLEKDFKDGKITQEEYMKKLQENLILMQGQSTEMIKSVMVEAGYMVTAKDKISNPEPISSDDNKWFTDANFYK